MTIIETTLDAQTRPAQLAGQYRQRDLLLQDAMLDYRHSPTLLLEEEALLESWHQAQRILEDAPAVPSKQPNGKKGPESIPTTDLSPPGPPITKATGDTSVKAGKPK